MQALLNVESAENRIPTLFHNCVLRRALCFSFLHFNAKRTIKASVFFFATRFQVVACFMKEPESVRLLCCFTDWTHHFKIILQFISKWLCVAFFSFEIFQNGCVLHFYRLESYGSCALYNLVGGQNCVEIYLVACLRLSFYFFHVKNVSV